MINVPYIVTGSSVLQESFLQELGQELPDVYYELGLKLGVSRHVMDQIELRVNDKGVNNPLFMLQKWTQALGNENIAIWKEELCKGLKLLGRNDLVRTTEQMFEQQQHSGEF